ncbi:MAG: hypothetical protein WBP42_04480 [Candidatus Zixiibacteriota bacterium]
MPTPNIHNGYDYSDLRATSFLPFVAGQTGLIVWPKDSVVSAGGRQPIALATIDDKLLVRYSDFLELRQRGNGALIWGREVHFGTDLQAAQSGVITRSYSGFYQTISYDSRVFEGYFLPFLGERTHLNWVLPDTNETRYAYCSAPVPVHGPSGTPIEAAGVYARYLPEEERLLWFFERTGAPRGARMTGDGSTVCLGTLNFIDIFPANADSTTKFASLPVENLHAVAINHEDKILAIDEFEGQMRLRCLGRDGAEIWANILKSIGAVSQPPISAPGARCWITVGSTIYHYVENKLIWEYSVPAEDKLFVTACADNSLLIACGSLFTILSEQGLPVLNRVFAGKFTCRPLVDDQGRIFLGGSQGLLCIR